MVSKQAQHLAQPSCTAIAAHLGVPRPRLAEVHPISPRAKVSVIRPCRTRWFAGDLYYKRSESSRRAQVFHFGFPLIRPSASFSPAGRRDFGCGYAALCSQGVDRKGIRSSITNRVSKPHPAGCLPQLRAELRQVDPITEFLAVLSAKNRLSPSKQPRMKVGPATGSGGIGTRSRNDTRLLVNFPQFDSCMCVAAGQSPADQLIETEQVKEPGRRSPLGIAGVKRVLQRRGICRTAGGQTPPDRYSQASECFPAGV